MNVDFYVEWTRAIVHGNLLEIDNIENGRSVSAENASIHGLTYLLTMDADGTHSVEDAKKLYLNRHSSILIIGSRYLRGASIRDWSIFRILLTYGGHFVTMFAFFRD